MGGGTGTGAAPGIAKAARDRGILTVGVVTKPFMFEGARRMRSADAGIAELQEHVDTLIVIPNQNLFLVANPNTTFKEAFTMADEVLQQGVRGITDLMVMPGRSEEHTSELQSLMRISYAVFCLKKKTKLLYSITTSIYCTYTHADARQLHARHIK